MSDYTRLGDILPGKILKEIAKDFIDPEKELESWKKFMKQFDKKTPPTPLQEPGKRRV